MAESCGRVFVQLVADVVVVMDVQATSSCSSLILFGLYSVSSLLLRSFSLLELA